MTSARQTVEKIGDNLPGDLANECVIQSVPRKVRTMLIKEYQSRTGRRPHRDVMRWMVAKLPRRITLGEDYLL